MKSYVINLDRSPDRWRSFARANSALLPRIERVSAVDGRTLDRADLAARGLIAADLRYSDGAIGNALSHLAFWDRAIAQDVPLTIFEDDAILNHDFFARADDLLRGLGDGWDLVLWAWNFDSILTFELAPGVSRCVGRFDQQAMRDGIAAFQAAALRPALYRLYATFGVVCYSVSPRGARALRDMCFPIRNMDVPIPGLGRSVPNRDIGVLFNAIFPQVAAYVSFPPLAITPNDHAISTVLEPQQRPPA